MLCQIIKFHCARIVKKENFKKDAIINGFNRISVWLQFHHRFQVYDVNAHLTEVPMVTDMNHTLVSFEWEKY
jgi:predicted transcriptional regulator